MTATTGLPKIDLINPWLLGEECKPIIICDADKAFHYCLKERYARSERAPRITSLHVPNEF
jgi:hypothetical protein